MISVLTLLAAVGSGLTAGLFFVFSAFMMTVLAALPAPHGIAAMQQVNRKILNPLFGLLFGGTTLLCLVVAASAVFGDAPGGVWRLAGGLSLVLGTFVVTMVFNVPLNNRLDAADPEAAGELWSRYLRVWVAWNHVRTLTSTAAAVLLTIAYGLS